MIVQFSNVTFLLYHARYSPLTILFLTCYVFGVPERVFRVEVAAVEHGVFDVLKRILAFELQSARFDIARAHGKYTLSAQVS